MASDTEMRDASGEDEEMYIDVNQYRKLVKKFINSRRYQTALFWAEKVAKLSENNPQDIYWLAHTMFLLKEYHRAAHVIKINGLEKTNIPCYNLYLESLYEGKEFNEAVAAINHIDMEYLATSMLTHPNDSYVNMWLADENKNEVMASIYYLKGKIYEAMENRALAMDNYIRALKKSIYCYEALEALVQHEMLKAWEEKKLIDELPFSQQCNEADAKLIKILYESKLKKYYETLQPHTNAEETPIGNSAAMRHIKELIEKLQKKKPQESQIPTPEPATKLFASSQDILSPANEVLENLKSSNTYSLQSSLHRVSMGADNQSHFSKFEPAQKNDPVNEIQEIVPLSACLTKLEESSDMMASNAEKLFYDCEYKQSLDILNELLKRDPYHNGALTIQIGCLVELKDSNKLYYVAHKLVDRYPEKAISWYAVGCYYDLIGKSDPARRYLSKATSLDRLFGPAWLAYGHSFAKENEHDQAMAAYFKAIQLMKGCHLPLLYIGVECGLTKNLELAEQFFYQSMSIAPLDVFVLHELGVIKYEFEYYETAEEVFRATAEIVTTRARQNREEVSPRWAPLFNNLGHSCRKNKKYREALEYHQLALLLKPQKADTLTAIGFVNSLMGNLDEAVTYFHKSLAINRDCVVTSTILRICMVDLMENETLIDKICGINLNYKFTPLGEKPETRSSKKILKARIPKFRFHDRSSMGDESDIYDEFV